MYRPTTLIDLSSTQACDPAIVGNKFARLADAQDLAEVPPAWCISADWLTRALGPARLSKVADLFHDVAATAGNELINLDARLSAALQGLELPAELWAAIADIADSATPWAVRSSTLVEDGARHSHAGLYESFLNLHGTRQVAAAVLACWRSFYNPRAVLARLRVGDTDPSPRMAVIIQRMVAAELAGVAFTQTDRTTVSATIGTGEHLVAGTTDATRYDIPGTGIAPPPYDHLARLAGTLKDRLGHEIDIEWAWNQGGIRLLQVRPVTATLQAAESHGPLFAATSLYFSDTLPNGITLGDCAELYLTITGKRAHLFRLAAGHGIAGGDGWIVTMNGAGLSSPAHRPQWWDRLDGEVVIDLGSAARQNILQAAQVEDFLATVLNLTGDPHTRHTFLLRRFIRGQAGAITHLLPDGRIAMEHSDSGLLAINRGLATPHVLTLPKPGDEPSWKHLVVPAPWTTDIAHRMADFTERVDALHPGAYLEWVLHNGDEPHFIDYSVTGTTAVATTAEGITLSPGTARGPLLVLDDSDALTRLSIAPIVSISGDADVPESHYIARLLTQVDAYPSKPIIYASLPYVILSRLLDHVAGFVFGGGSALCHLAILLREAGIPAIVAPQPQAQTGGQIAVIDNGALHLAQAQTA